MSCLTVFFYTWFLLITCSGDQPVEVYLGENAVLPCHLPKTFASLNSTRVDWQTKDTSKKNNHDVVFLTGPESKAVENEKMVHHFYKGREDLSHQSPAYHNRTRLLTSQLHLGDFSLELSNVSEGDNLTTFQCVTFDNGKPKFLNNITVLVLFRKDVPTIHDSSRYGRVWYIGAPAAVGLMILMILLFIAKELQNGEGPQCVHLTAAETRVELEIREDEETRVEVEMREDRETSNSRCREERGRPGGQFSAPAEGKQ